MKIFFDFEFHEDGRTIEPISLGMAREDGARLYYEFAEYDRDRATPWLKKNVIVHLTGPIVTRHTARKEILHFVSRKIPEFWGYFADYDWVCLCQLYGTMMDLPKGWPMYCRDIKQLYDESGCRDLPPQGMEHHALADAKWNMDAYNHIMRSINGDMAASA